MSAAMTTTHRSGSRCIELPKHAARHTLVFELPKHAAGVYPVKVYVKGKGLAAGQNLWFIFGGYLQNAAPPQVANPWRRDAHSHGWRLCVMQTGGRFARRVRRRSGHCLLVLVWTKPSTVRPWARGFCPQGRPGPLGFGLFGRLPRHGVGGFMFNSSSSGRVGKKKEERGLQAADAAPIFPPRRMLSPC